MFKVPNLMYYLFFLYKKANLVELVVPDWCSFSNCAFLVSQKVLYIWGLPVYSMCISRMTNQGWSGRHLKSIFPVVNIQNGPLRHV